MADGPLVCVVTPVYNGEPYIAECVESVLRQTYDRWEYVVCDNRSTDRTLEIVRSYAARDPRVRVVEADEHVPHVASLNRAMRHVSPASAYTKVVHADDWLFAECLERMVAVAREHPSVGIVGAYRLSGRRVDLDALPVDQTFFDGRELARRSLLSRIYVFGSPTSLLLRSDLVLARDPFYDDTTFYGVPNFAVDTDACYALLRESDFGFVHQVLTYTRLHELSWSATVAATGGYPPRQIAHLHRHGPVFLTPEEYDRILSMLVRRYLVFLARRPHWLRYREFRHHHRVTLPRALAHLASRRRRRRRAARAGPRRRFRPPRAGARRPLRPEAPP